MIIFHKFYLYKFYTCSSGTLILAPSACRTKPIGLGSPKRTNSLCGKLPHKKALLRAVPCTGITKPCGCQVRDMAKPIPPHPKVDNTLDGHCPQKSRPAQVVCPLRDKPAWFCFQVIWEDFECSPTSTREAPHPCLISLSSRHVCTTTTHGTKILPTHTFGCCIF